MVLMNVNLDNFLVFSNYSMNLSYAKKIVNSSIPEEYLDGRPNFRYKKLIVLMGANATGKTALSRILMAIFNFIAKREYASIVELIEDSTKDAFFSVDLAFSDFRLYRVTGIFKGKKTKSAELDSKDIIVEVKSEVIQKNDSYERCASRLDVKSPDLFDNYIKALESVPYLTWKFEDSFALSGHQRAIEPIEPNLYTVVLEKTMQALDPRIKSVDRIRDTENTFVIRYDNHVVLIKDGIVMEPNKLSSGTAEGIGVANMITAMKLKAMDFYFCDEKFSHIHSFAEKAFLSVLVEMIGQNQQLFFTTHNSDILDLNLPLHSYAFLRRDENNNNSITCVFASDYLKKNTVSLKNAVDNDIFSSSPDTDRIYRISESIQGGSR